MSDGVCDHDSNRNQSEHSQNRSSATAHSKSDTGQGRKRSKGRGVTPHLQTNLPLMQPALGWNRSQTTAQSHLFQRKPLQPGFWRIYCPCKFSSSATKSLRCCSASVLLKLFTALLQLGMVPRLLPGQEYTHTDSIDERDKNVLYVCVSCLEQNSR